MADADDKLLSQALGTAKTDAQELADALKKALEEEAKAVALATNGIRALGQVMRGDLLGGAKSAAGALAFIGPQGKIAAAGIEIAIGALESLWSTSLATTAKFHPGLITQYQDALDDLHAAMGEGLYPIVKEMIPHLRSMADWLHNNAAAVRIFTEAMMSSAGFMLRVTSLMAGLGSGESIIDLFNKTKGPAGTSYGLAAQTASYSDIFEAGDQRRLAIATQQMTFAEQTANNTERAASMLEAMRIVLEKGENTPREVLDFLAGQKKK